jgi:hypothetical protein
MATLPKMLKVKDIADAIGWNVDRTRYALKKLGILKKFGRDYVTTMGEIERAWPDMADAINEE